MVADNVLCGAQVLTPEDPKSQALDAFNKQLKIDNRVSQVLFPLRYGCNIVRKK